MQVAGAIQPVQLRAATPEDRFLIRKWLREPGAQDWWGSADGAEAEITLAMGSQAALCRIVEREGTATGYTHAVEIGLWQHNRPAGVSAGAWSIELFLAPQHRNVDLGQAALALLTADVFATTLAVACSGVVSIRNELAARAYEKAGFRWQRIWNDPLYGPSWLMLKERPARRPPNR